MSSPRPIESPRVFRTSDRAQKMPASPIRKLVPLADAAKARGTHIYHLNIGQPDIETPLCMRNRLRELESTVLEYSPSAGTAEYIRSVQRYYEQKVGQHLETNQILGTTGGSEAILFSLMATCNQGDEILVVEPFYANYTAFATLAGVNIVPLTSSGREGFHVRTREAWERVLTPRTRAVIVCNPGNPTGTVFTREELEIVGQFCREHGLFLISDEVYREFVYDGGRAVSALELPDSDEFVIVVDSLSKRYSACGIRLGSLVTRNAAIYDAAMRMAQGRLSPPGIAQFIAVATETLDDSYAAGIVKEYQRRRDVLFEGLMSIPGVFLTKPEGAFYCMPQLPIESGDDFAVWLLSEFSHEGETVMVAPASGFYKSPLGRNEVRIAYVLNEERLRRSVELLRIALERYPGRTK